MSEKTIKQCIELLKNYKVKFYREDYSEKFKCKMPRTKYINYKNTPELYLNDDYSDFPPPPPPPAPPPPQYKLSPPPIRAYLIY